MGNKIKEKLGLREFSLSTLAVDNATSVFILTIMILIFGVDSYQKMPKEQFPEVSFPTVFVNTPYFGNSASDIESLITRPIEKELMNAVGVKDVRSSSMQDYSVIIAEFISEMPIDEAKKRVKDAVDLAKSELPNDLDQDPLVEDVNLSELPIMTVNVSGDYTNDALKKYAEILKDRFEDINSVSKVEMKGDLEREVKVDVDLPKMKSMEVSFSDIENAIRSENMTMSGGEIIRNDFRRAIRVIGEFQKVSDLENMIVKSENQFPIYLRDIAKVTFGYKDRTSIARSNRLPVISLDVIKRKGENLLSTSDFVKEIIADAIANDLPDNLEISTFNDQSINTRNEVNNLLNSIISGVILVVLVLLFFLGIRNALFVGLAIPLSMLMGIMILYLSGVTMNIVVLFSLILALGLLVDNGIVVVENIYRYMQNGYNGKDSAKYGAGEVALPIIASTATTLAAFLPLAFWPGIMGSFMKYMPMTLIIVLTSSLFVALVINTVFTSKFMKIDVRNEEKSARNRKRRNVLIGALLMTLIAVPFHFMGHDNHWVRNLLGFTVIINLVNFFLLRPASFGFQDKVLPVLERGYDWFINKALHKSMPGIIFIGSFLLLFLSFVLLQLKTPKVEFFPTADPLYVNAFIELPVGSDIQTTNEIMKQIEDKVTETVEPYSQVVEAVLSQIGENTADPNQPPEPGVTPNKARLTVSFVPSQERDGVSTEEIMNEIRNNVKGMAGVQIVVDQNQDGPPTGKPINLELKGEDIDVLAGLSEALIVFINDKNIPGIEELKADVQIGKQELIINVNRDAARRYGVSTFAIADAVRTSVFGKEVSKFKEGEDEYPIFVRLDEKYRKDINTILNQPITFRSPSNGQISQVPINAVSDVEYTSTYTSIKRRNQDRLISIVSNVLDGFNANEIVAEIGEVVKDFDLPDGYSIEFSGEQQQQAEDTAFLSTAFMIAIFSIFIIIVAQFNSIISPFIIILSVVFSTIGVLLGLIITGEDIVVIMTGVGIISLAGVVVNNAIVLIDYINLLIKRKRQELDIEDMSSLPNEVIKQCIIEGGATRLRPVLLTAITTVLGLIPLAIGFNFNFFTFVSELDPHLFIGGDNVAFWGPMAWTIIYGLAFATFLTLVVVPVMYWLAYLLKSRIGRLFA